jgi:hypothetical protein
MGEEEGGEGDASREILSFTWRQAVAPDSARVLQPRFSSCALVNRREIPWTWKI